MGGERAITDELGLRVGAGMGGGGRGDAGGVGKSVRQVESMQLTRARFAKLEDTV